MSTYYNIEAELIYPDKKTMEMALAPIREGGWLRDDNTLIFEETNVANGGAPVINDLVFVIPDGIYRQLSGSVTSLALELAEAGHYKESCLDGECYFHLWENGETLNVSDEKIAEYLKTEVDHDLFLLNAQEYEKKHDEDEDDYWDARNEAFYDAMDNAFVKLDGFDDEENDYQIINYCKKLFERKEIVFKSEESIIFNGTSIQTLIRMQQNGSFKKIPDYMNSILIRKGAEKQEITNEMNSTVNKSTKDTSIKGK
jgi:hypothetical protein